MTRTEASALLDDLLTGRVPRSLCRMHGAPPARILAQFNVALHDLQHAMIRADEERARRYAEHVAGGDDG